MKKYLVFSVVAVLLLVLVSCAAADDITEFLFKNPWGASRKDISSSMNQTKTQIDDTEIITYYPDISGFNELTLIFVDDKLMGGIVSVNYSISDEREFSLRYNMLVLNCDDAFGQGYSNPEYDRFMIGIRDFCDTCGLPNNYYSLSKSAYSDLCGIWSNWHTNALLLMNYQGNCTMFFFPSEGRAAEINMSRKNTADLDHFYVRGVTWGDSMKDVRGNESNIKGPYHGELTEYLDAHIDRGNYAYDVDYLFIDDKLVCVYESAVKYYRDQFYTELYNQYGELEECSTEEFTSVLGKIMPGALYDGIVKRKQSVRCWRPDASTNIYFYMSGDWCYAFFLPDKEVLLNLIPDFQAAFDEDDKEKKAYYETGILQLENGEYEEAINTLQKAGNYKDAADYVLKAHYELGMKALSDGDTEKAIEEFSLAGEYQPAVEQLQKYHYDLAEKYLAEEKWDEASSEFSAARGYMDASSRINEPLYKKAESFFEAEEYDKAIEAFSKIGYYLDASERIQKIHYMLAEKAIEEGRYDEAIDEFIRAGDYQDAGSRAKELCYSEAEKYLASKQYDKAIQMFKKAGSYLDSAERIEKIKNDLAYEALKTGKWEDAVGAHVLFGHYEQDGNPDNGPEGIEWIVLNADDGKALLMSLYAIDALEFNNRRREITWDKSSIRKWLNNDFMRNAFSKDEKKVIVKSRINVSDNYVKGKKKTKDRFTNDNVFLINHTDSNELKLSSELLKCKATAFASQQGLEESGGFVDWWSRTVGVEDKKMAFCFTSSGAFKAFDVDSKLGIRPMIYVKAEYFMPVE